MSSIAFRSSATLLNGQITLPLRRFSYCTVLHLKSPSQWNHTKAQKDLFAVIDTVRELGVSEQMMEKHVLRVFNGRDMLETVELEYLQREAQLEEDPVRNQRLEEHGRSTLLTIKPPQPALAIRYPLVDRKIRRVQYAFEDSNSFETCVRILRSFALPFVDRSLENRPATVESSISHVRPPRLPQQADVNFQQVQRYGLPTAPSQYSAEPYPGASHEYLARPHPITNNVTSWVPSSAQPICTVSSQPSVTYRGSQEDSNAFNMPSRHHHSLIDDTSAVSTHYNGSLGSQHSSIPVSSQLGCILPYAGKSTCDNATHSFQTNESNRLLEWRPLSAPDPQTNRSSSGIGTLDDILPPVRELPFPDKRATTPNQASEAVSDKSPKSKAKAKTVNKVTKPRKKATNTPDAFSVQSKLTGPSSKSGIPGPKPRRSRAKPVAKKGDQLPSSSAPSEILLTKIASKPAVVEVARAPMPPPLTSPTYRPATEAAEEATTRTLSPQAQRVNQPFPLQISSAQADMEASLHAQASLPEPSREAPSGSDSQTALTKSTEKIVVHSDVPSMEASIQHPGTSNCTTDSVEKENDDARPSTTKPLKDYSIVQAQIDKPVAQPLFIPRAPLADAATQTSVHPLAESSGNVQLSGASRHAPTADASTSTIHLEDFFSSLDAYLHRYQHFRASQPSVIEKDRIAQYASKPDSERAKIVENLICECIEDENFLTLAKDVHGCSKRSGLDFLDG